MDMIILGIDPGIGRCGWGLIKVEGSKINVVNFGCIETEPKGGVGERLLVISLEIEKILKKYKPDVLSIEELFFGKNITTAFSVGQARGVALLKASEKGLEIFEYKPVEVKMAVTGYGKADKKQIGQMVKAILKLEKIPKIDDTSDALAVALTHAFSSKVKNLVSRN